MAGGRAGVHDAVVPLGERELRAVAAAPARLPAAAAQHERAAPVGHAVRRRGGAAAQGYDQRPLLLIDKYLKLLLFYYQ